jgi:hypothetical protein
VCVGATHSEGKVAGQVVTGLSRLTCQKLHFVAAQAVGCSAFGAHLRACDEHAHHETTTVLFGFRWLPLKLDWISAHAGNIGLLVFFCTLGTTSISGTTLRPVQPAKQCTYLCGFAPPSARAASSACPHYLSHAFAHQQPLLNTATISARTLAACSFSACAAFISLPAVLCYIPLAYYIYICYIPLAYYIFLCILLRVQLIQRNARTFAACSSSARAAFISLPSDSARRCRTSRKLRPSLPPPDSCRVASCSRACSVQHHTTAVDLCE